MTHRGKYPSDLAAIVCSEIIKRKATPPPLRTLESLFELMYFASLKSEEAQPIVVHIVYLNPKAPDPKPPQLPPRDRWSCVAFPKPIPMSVATISKLATASDPRSSSFAVYHDSKGRLYIWGLVDQGNRYHDFVRFESDSGPERPGLFQTSIAGLGHVAAYFGYDIIAELRVNNIIRDAPDVLWTGPVYKMLLRGLRTHLSVTHLISNSSRPVKSSAYRTALVDNSIAGLCRLLLRMQSFGHGGTILIAPHDHTTHLNVKYPIRYERLKSAVQNSSYHECQYYESYDSIFDDHIEKNAPTLPTGLYLDAAVSKDELDASRSELDGALWFTSLLSRVDGAVLMTPGLEVRGFGVEITANQRPVHVYASARPTPSTASIKEIDYEHYGTRHRSVMRFCNQVTGSIGFIVSQDGDVRAIARIARRLIIWDNIKLTFHDYVKAEPRLTTTIAQLT